MTELTQGEQREKVPQPAPIDFNALAGVTGWPEEEWDDYVPRGGFIADFVAHLKGVETATSFCVWAALFIISSVVKREAVYKWLPGDPLLPNLYVILVSPPGMVRKNVVIRAAKRVMREMVPYISTEALRWDKEVNIHDGSITPEAFRDSMTPRRKHFDEGGHEVTAYRYSQIALIVGELATAINRRQYNETLITQLTALYDGEDTDTSATRGEGKVMLKDIYATLLGGATPDGLRDTFPESTFGGGFMSRTILVTEDESVRYYPEPVVYDGVPSRDDLARRLAWIAEGAQGEYYLSSKAKALHHQWYKEFKKGLKAKGDELQRNAETRLDTILLRVATLIRAQKYEPGTVIGEREWRQAQAIVTRTLHEAGSTMSEIGVGPQQKTLQKVIKTVKRHERIGRRQLSTNLSRYVDIDVLDNLIRNLFEMGLIWAEDKDGKGLRVPTYTHRDVYVWRGKMKESEDEDGDH